MSSYGYVPWSNKGSSYSKGSAASSTDRSSRPNYGSLPRNYGNSRAEPERSEKPYTSRFARGYSTERSTENVKAPEVRKYGGYNAPETPSLRVGSSSRFGGQIARSPISEKSPNVFGVSPVTEKSPTPFGAAKEAEMITLVTRSTSPTPPCNSTFLRMKRAEMEPCTKCQVPKSSFRPYVVNGETQTDDPKKQIQTPRYRGYIKPEEKPPEEKKESRVGGLSLSRPTDLPLRQKPEPLLSKSQTSVRLPPQIPNKDFRKSVLNMDPSKSKIESSSSESSSETSSEDSSEEDKPKPPPRDDSKTVIARTTTTPSPVKVTVKTLEAEKPEKKFVLRKFDSGERAWWMSNKDIPNIDKSDEEKKKSILKSSDEESKSWSKSISKTGSQISKTTSSASLSKSSTKEERPKTLPLRKFDSTDESFASAGEGTNSIQKSKSFARTSSKKSEESKIPLSRCTSGLQRTGSNLSDLTSDEDLRKLTKTPSVKSLPRTPSSASVTGKPPIKRSESKDTLEHTPGFNRIHKKLGSNTDVSSDGLWSPTRRMLVRVESGERDWWLSDEEKAEQKKKMKKPSEKTWISSFTNIDHILGTEAPPPAAFRTPDNSSDDSDSCEDCFEVKPDQVKIHDSTAQVPVIQKGARKQCPFVDDCLVYCRFLGVLNNGVRKGSSERALVDRVLAMTFTCRVQFLNDGDPFDSNNYPEPIKPLFHTFSLDTALVNQIATLHRILKAPHRLDDTALQLCKDGDYGPYLDLDSSISEQQEEFEHLDSFSSNRKNSIVLRTQLSVRVHTIIEKLLKSEGKELRRALFSLKNIFQEDKDLVHAFVQNDGLATLIKVGTDADQNYQNYILRALGQVMLYVDGMNGVADHPATLQWLYNLTSSKFRLIVKTVLKLLIVFVEYAEANCILLVKAIKAVDYVHLSKPWSRIMSLMKGYDAADTEIFIYSMTLINKTLNGLPDQDLYYDQIDSIEEQGMESIVRLFTAKQGTDLDLLRQFQIYEAVLRHEDDDGEETNMLRQLDDTIRKSVESRKKQALNTPDRRKSRRFSTSNSPIAFSLSPRALTAPPPPDDIYKLNAEGAGVTPGLRRRRERAERQKCFIQEQIQGKALKFFTAANERLDNSSSDDSNNNLDEKSDPEKDINLNKTEIKNNEEGGTNGCISDLNQKLNSPSDESKNPFGEMKGIISKAKEELAKSQMRGDSPRSPQGADILIRNQVPEIKKSETELHWDSLKENLDRELTLDDLDFTDLSVEEERDLFAPAGSGGGPPPPPPPINLPPSCPSFAPPPAPLPNTNTNKTKKTLKLFWKEVRDDPIIMAKLNNDKTLWDELNPVVIDTQKLEHLFESRAKDLITKKQQETNKNKEIIVLSPKRSNAINIGMTKLPSPRSIKASIMKMDSTIMNREGIEKLLTMLPTEEETSKIQEAQTANPDLPLGSAEQFLLTLASISELPARLKLWAFKLDYMNLEREIADPLMDLKQGMETLKSNKTFKAILGTLLSIGIFLNGSEVKGFQIDYLLKVPEVKDTVHKHTLLHHLCHFVMEKFPDSTDLYSEIGAVTRASKVDFEELAANIHKMEQECKASFDHLKVISKHDGTTNMKLKLSDFLADCAERIIVLDKIHRRVIHRFQKFCLWLGLPMHQAGITKPNDLCRVISEFSLEYRTTRERVLQQLERKANHRERNKTRGKMITEVGKFKSREDQQDEKLKELLRNSNINGDELNTSPLGTFLRRSRKDSTPVLAKGDASNGNLTDGDDEILETLVKTATRSMTPRMTPRDRKRTGNANRKSLRRTLKNGLSEEDRQHLAAYKGY